MKAFAIILLIFLCSIKNKINSNAGVHTPEEFGAAGDGKTDDTMPLTKALNSGFNIYFNGARKYKIINTVKVKTISNKTIDLRNATIIRDPAKIGFVFVNCTGVIFRNGNIICSTPPSEGAGSENCVNFIQCKNTVTTGLYIDGSDEMGIAYMDCIGVSASFNHIKNCYRDGIHEVYCAKVRVFNNIISNIKDDALACHDYGSDVQKPFLIANGYPQSSDIKIYNNRITNCYQGITSISCRTIEIKNNRILGTVGAGIAVFNTRAIANGSARVKGASIINNTITNSCSAQKIMGVTYPNRGQNSTGRAAIFVGTLGSNSQMGNATRLANVSVTGNIVTNSGVNGLWLSDTDNATLLNNTFTNCCIETSAFSGTVCAIYRLTNAHISGNKTVDTRVAKKHNFGFDIQNVSGKISGLTNTGAMQGNHIYKATAF